MAVDENKREVWLEVSDQVIEALEIDYRKATEERVRLIESQGLRARELILVG